MKGEFMEAIQFKAKTAIYILAIDEPIHACIRSEYSISFNQGDAIKISIFSEPLPGLVLVEINGQVRLKRIEMINGVRTYFPPEDDQTFKPIFLGQVTDHVRLSRWFSNAI